MQQAATEAKEGKAVLERKEEHGQLLEELEQQLKKEKREVECVKERKRERKKKQNEYPHPPFPFTLSLHTHSLITLSSQSLITCLFCVNFR